jgi:hypothetical protein
MWPRPRPRRHAPFLHLHRESVSAPAMVPPPRACFWCHHHVARCMTVRQVRRERQNRACGHKPSCPARRVHPAPRSSAAAVWQPIPQVKRGAAQRCVGWAAQAPRPAAALPAPHTKLMPPACVLLVPPWLLHGHTQHPHTIARPVAAQAAAMLALTPAVVRGQSKSPRGARQLRSVE